MNLEKRIKFNLKSMTRKELEKLQADVEKALGKVNERELKAARDAAAKVAAKHGFSLNELTGSAAPTPKPKPNTGPKNPALPKYKNLLDETQTWTGKGRRPVWFVNAIATGTSPEAMEI